MSILAKYCYVAIADGGTYMSKEETVKSSKKRGLTVKLGEKSFVLLGIIIAVALVFGIGYKAGVSHQKKEVAAQRSKNLRSQSFLDTLPRWTSIGTITNITENKLVLKDIRGDTKEAKLTKESRITDRMGKTLTRNDLKKDQKIIVSGERDKKGNLTVTRIRVQPE